MKKILFAASLFASLAVSSAAEAKCYRYDGAPSDVYVCVGKNGKDDFADRNKGQEICTAKSGKKCGPVSSTSSSCHSNIDKCFDENGQAHRELSGY